jgi:hypothetical protein
MLIQRQSSYNTKVGTLLTLIFYGFVMQYSWVILSEFIGKKPESILDNENSGGEVFLIDIMHNSMPYFEIQIGNS